MQQGIFAHGDNAVAYFNSEKLADKSSLVSQPPDEDIEEADLRQKWRKIVANDGDQGEIDDSLVSAGVANGSAGLKINKIKETVHSHGYQKTKQGYDNLLPAHTSIADIAKGRAKTGDEGRMAKPTEDNSANNQEYQEVLGVERKIPEVLDHGKACTD